MPEPRGPAPALWDHLAAVEASLATAGGLVLCTDFDGTLAPIAADPDAPALPAGRRAVLAALAADPAVAVALVSGRSLADLADRAAVEGATYVGNHGAERRHAGERRVATAAPERVAVADAAAALADRLADVPGCTVEDKGLGLTVHHRRAPADATPRVREAVRTVAARTDGLAVFDGKQVFELRADGVDKGTAVRDLAARHPDDWLAASLGDDASDEAAFRALGDDALTVHVGDDRRTAARYRLADPADVGSFLGWLRVEGRRALG